MDALELLGVNKPLLTYIFEKISRIMEKWWFLHFFCCIFAHSRFLLKGIQLEDFAYFIRHVYVFFCDSCLIHVNFHLVFSCLLLWKRFPIVIWMDLFKPKRSCQFTAAGIEEIDYKDVDLLKKFVNETGKIMPARMTGTTAKYQRQLTRAIKRARLLALLPFTDSH